MKRDAKKIVVTYCMLSMNGTVFRTQVKKLSYFFKLSGQFCLDSPLIKKQSKATQNKIQYRNLES